MADFKPSKKTIKDFNNGVQYKDYDPTIGQNGDEVQAETINNLIESQLFTQGMATNEPDVSEIAGDGKAGMQITTAPDGSARLKPINLKGTGIKRLALKNHTQVGGSLTKNTYDVEFTNGEKQELDMYAVNGTNGNPPIMYSGIGLSVHGSSPLLSSSHIDLQYGGFSIDASLINEGDVVIFQYNNVIYMAVVSDTSSTIVSLNPARRLSGDDGTQITNITVTKVS